MVCVLQSKLPRSSAVFQLYCQPFFLPLKLLTIYTFYCSDKAEQLLFNVFCVCFTNSFFWGRRGILCFSLEAAVHLWWKHLYTCVLNVCVCVWWWWFFFRLKGRCIFVGFLWSSHQMHDSTLILDDKYCNIANNKTFFFSYLKDRTHHPALA